MLLEKETRKSKGNLVSAFLFRLRERLRSFVRSYLPLLHSRSEQGERRFRDWSNMAVIVLIVSSIVSGIVTYAALKEAPPFGDDPNTIIWLLNMDLILLVGLVGVVAHRIVSVWSGRKRGLAGSHLHVRLVYIFSVLAATPAIIMTIFSAFFFHFGVQTWFSDKIQTAVTKSQAVAEAYLEEHQQNIRADILAMANDLNRESALLIGNAPSLERVMQRQSLVRNLSEAIVFDSSGQVIARSGLTFSLEFETVPNYQLERAQRGDVVITTGAQDDRVRALVKLNGFVDSFLYVGRMVDPQVLMNLKDTNEAVASYTDLKNRYSNLQIIVTFIFVLVGFLLVLFAVWFGLILARQLVEPISGLIRASDSVRGGNLSARFETEGVIEEFDYLGRAFNRMTKTMEEQQNELIIANRQIDRRRHVLETVLSGVSSGVLGLDRHNVITMANESACALLQEEHEAIHGEEINVFLPAFSSLLDEARANPERYIQKEIVFTNAAGKKRTFLVRIAIEMLGAQDTGAIVTFDDISELLIAQKKAAWSDVARRIAHEIKNPLTPIQLSAERLNRKYLKEIQSDPETFKQCTDTIVKHVADIGRMVSEFSSFARMPEPKLKRADFNDLISESIMLHKQAAPNVMFCFDKTVNELLGVFDAQLMRQALGNLFQNASDSILSVHEKGKISVLSGEHEDYIFAIVSDDGPGFPQDVDTSSLLEPYVTRKEKGTGLGLAIVQKVVEDHGGKLILGAPDWLNAEHKEGVLDGATVVIMLHKEKGEV